MVSKTLNVFFRIMEIIFSLLLTAALAAIIVLSLIIKNLKSATADSKEQMGAIYDRQIRTYEESTSRLLEETRRQYERQIEILNERLEKQGEEIRRQSAMEFSVLANESLSLQSQRLKSINDESLDNILTPLKMQIDDFRKAVNDSYLREESTRRTLSERIDSLIKSNQEIGREAGRLTNALRGNNVMQGKWGEIILEKILQNAGFIRDEHYICQAASAAGQSIIDEDGRRQRPDILLLLPDNHRLIIDAKTSMTAYFRFCEAETEVDSQNALKEHVSSIRKHIDELGAKQYHKNIASAMEHTLMFIPNDAAFLAALRGDNSICDYASKRNVVIVSRAHLLSVMQLISQIWRVENQNRNAEEIAKKGGELYDKFAAFLGEFSKIQRALNSANNAYQASLHHLSDGQASILRRASQLKEMGARTTKTLPPLS